jgi:hypothetical protein
LAADRCEVADRDAAAGYHEALARIERPHDLAAVIAQFALRHFPDHQLIVAQVLQPGVGFSGAFYSAPGRI